MDRLLRRADVCNAVGLCVATIYKKMKANEFPRPVKISDNAVAWRESDVKNWIDTRVAA